ncbi:MAG: hypothetical protein ACREDX_00110 [Aestuariivirga sp.]
MKRLVIACALAASLAFGLSSPAGAKVKIGVFFGTPHYDYQVGPGYIYRDGYGWYEPAPVYGYRLSCGEARAEVRSQGYRNVSTIECRGRTYTFEATRRSRLVIVYVDSRTGNVWRD